jgi:hypothetical protein
VDSTHELTESGVAPSNHDDDIEPLDVDRNDGSQSSNHASRSDIPMALTLRSHPASFTTSLLSTFE